MNALRLVAFRLRRERVILPVWFAGIAVLVLASGVAIDREFGGPEERTALAALAAGNPAFLFLRGAPDGADVGALLFFQTSSFLAVLVGLMTTFLVVRHTRADEERGRSELLQATPIGRMGPLASALVVAASADLAVGVIAASACLALGLAVWSSILTGLALAAVGLAFAGCAALAAQVMPSPRGANGLAAAAVGIAYLVRGAGDALGTARDVTHVDPSWVALLSPIGWAQATRPFTSADPLPLLVPLALGVVTAGAAVALQARRDLGASLVAERPGRAEWRDAGATRLALRNQVATTLGWAVGAAVLGLLAGALAPLIADVVGANDDLAALIARLAPDLDVTTSDVFSVAVLGIAGTLATAAGVQALTRLRPDEAEGRAELLLATSLSRAGWFARHVAVAVGSAVAVALAGGIAAGVGFAATGGGAERIGTSLTAILVHLPAGLVFLALAALAFAVLPRLSVALGWGLLVAGLALGQLGGLLGLPKWLQDVSPLHHVPAVPIEDVEPVALAGWAGLAAAVFVVAGLAFRRRDVPA